MKCPIDNENLQMTERSGIEIDYCPKCRGVWLDRGELDKIIERISQDNLQRPAQPEQVVYQNQSHQNKPYYDKHGGGHRKKSILGEIFDF